MPSLGKLVRGEHTGVPKRLALVEAVCRHIAIARRGIRIDATGIHRLAPPLGQLAAAGQVVADLEEDRLLCLEQLGDLGGQIKRAVRVVACGIDVVGVGVGDRLGARDHVPAGVEGAAGDGVAGAGEVRQCASSPTRR